MNFWMGVLLGFIAGWVAEWIIDWNYWRRRTRIISTTTGENAGLQDATDQYRTETARLQNDLTATANLAQQRADELAALKSELATLKNALDSAHASLVQVQQQVSERDARIATLEAAHQSDRAKSRSCRQPCNTRNRMQHRCTPTGTRLQSQHCLRRQLLQRSPLRALQKMMSQLSWRVCALNLKKSAAFIRSCAARGVIPSSISMASV